MAAIAHADSFIADSTISPSSPNISSTGLLPEKDASSSTESNGNIKRVVRTYGRPKVNADVPVTLPNDWSTRARTLKTAPPNTEAQVIPESDHEDATEPAEGAAVFMGYAWRDKLREIDDFDNDDDALEGSNVQSVSAVEGNQLGADVTSLFEGSLSSLLSEPSNRSPSEKSASLFDGSLSSLQSEPSNPERHPNNRDSDASDSDDTRPDSNVLNSPQVHSSDTPPTSPSKHLALQGKSRADEYLVNRSCSGVSVGTSSTGEQRSGGRGGRTKERRSKALTKKEIAEMQKQSARLLADQYIEVHRADHRSGITIASLFDKIKRSSTGAVRESDPIVAFSSPGRNVSLRMDSFSGVGCESSPSTLKAQATSISSDPVKARPDAFVQENISLGDKLEEMPELDVIIREDDARRQKRLYEERAETEKKAKELAERKKKALEMFRSYDSDSDSDDGLEVEKLLTPMKSTLPAASTSSRPSLGIGGVRPKTRVVTGQSLELASKPMFLGKKNASRKRGTENAVSQKDLNGILLHRAEKQNYVIEEQKKAQWAEAGGTIRDKQVSGTEGTAVDLWLQKGATRDGEEAEEEAEEEEDPDYQSVDDEDEDPHEFKEDTNSTTVIMEEDSVVTFDQLDVSDEDADKENHHPAPRRMKSHMIIGSDEEDENEHFRIGSPSPIVIARDSSFATHFHSTPVGDKENSQELVCDWNDKENRREPIQQERTRMSGDDEQPGNASPHHEGPISGRSRQPISHLEGEGGLSTLPSTRVHRAPSLDRVFKVLHEEDKESTLGPVSPTRRQSDCHIHSPSSSPEGLDGPTLVSPSGFSQFFAENDRSTRLIFPKAGPSQLSSANSEYSLKKPVSGGHLGHVATNGDFEFTQPAGLLPAVNISDSQRREIDEMFGKDQEYKLEEAKRSKEESPTAKWKNQSAPYFGSFVPSQSSELSSQSIRQPLETLSLDPKDDDSTASEGLSPLVPRRRLTKRRPSAQSSPEKSDLPPSARLNAFNILKNGAVTEARRAQQSHIKLTRSEFVEREAQESDDELLAGFGDVRADGDEDEDGDEDLDAVVEGLVDDTALDEKTQAAELVFQKHLEHIAADDAEIEKIHQNAVDGKLRAKRRDRDMYFEDSDSDDDIRPRKEFLKKRRIEGDTLEAYGNNAETRAFYEAYQAPLATEELGELDYLRENDLALSQGSNMEDDSDEGPQETVDVATIRRELASSVRQGHPPASGSSDAENIDWLNSEDQDMADLEDIQIQSGPLNHKLAASAQLHSIPSAYNAFNGKKPSMDEISQLKAWANQESHSTRAANGRGGFSRRGDTSSSTSRNKGKAISKMPSNEQNKDKLTLKRSGISLISHIEKRKGFDT
ncbi:hypothetical protein BU17DRAFT_80350 [Hysterangium stoloniferum]|nr:hypothetical protein BU17DRAFT_80350 [Hysterangium stoloniferum]